MALTPAVGTPVGRRRTPSSTPSTVTRPIRSVSLSSHPVPALPALVTPLTPDGEVHLGDLARLVTATLDDGAAGVLVAGSTGEGTLLDPVSRAALTEVARKTVDRHRRSDALVLAGASGPTMPSLHDDVARLAAAGADHVLVLAPHTYPLEPDELLAAHLEVAEHAPVPTLAYHIPQLTGSALTPATVAELARHDRVVGMKDSSPDAERRAAFVAATSAQDFGVLTGHAPTLQAALSAGAAGSITAIANLRLRQVLALHRAVAEDDEVAATRSQQRLGHTEAALRRGPGSLPAVIKAALQLEGRIEERWCRAPLASVPPPRLDRVRTALLR